MSTFNLNSVTVATSPSGSMLTRKHLSGMDTQFVSMPTFAPQVALIGEICPGWRLIKPLVVTFEADDAWWVVSDDEFAVFGNGETRAEAASDYVSALIEYYQLIGRYDDKPSTALFRHLQNFLIVAE